MEDRELLELSARAAGVFLTPKTLAELFPQWTWDESFEPRHEDAGGMSGTVVVRNHEGELSGTTRKIWNPLADDGDALRLAVKLKLALALDSCCAMDHRRDGSHDGDWWGGGSDAHAGVSHEECDPYAATRRAIVRAAAKIATSASMPA